VGIAGGLVGGAGQFVSITAAGVVTNINRTNEEVNKVADVNFSYTVGAIRLGAEWSRGAFEGITGDPDVKRAATLDQIQVGGTYTLGPGVALIGFVQEALYDAGGAYIPAATGAGSARSFGVPGNNNIYAKSSDSTALVFETSIKF